MKREIKFKAKRLDSGVWITGYLLGDFEEEGVPTTTYILPFEAGRFDAYVEVDPETVCQYTGLNDKNGNDIYEGDEVVFDVVETDFVKNADFPIFNERGVVRIGLHDNGFGRYQSKFCKNILLAKKKQN